MRKELLNALEDGNLGEIQRLYPHGLGVMSERTFQGDNVLHISLREGHEQIVRWILGIPSLEPNLASDQNNDHNTPLHESLESSLASVQNNDHNTPLHEAARYGNAAFVETLLLRNRSCASHRNKFGETPLIIACKYGHRDAVRELLGEYQYTTETQEASERGSTSTSETHQSASQTTYSGVEIPSLLHAAVQGGCVEIVKEIVDHPSVSARLDDLMTKQDKRGRCAIHVAAMNGCWDIITEFICKRPDSIDIRSSDHKSVLHFAVQYNQLELVKNLLEGCKNDSKRRKFMVSRDHDDSHNTALHLAAKYLVDLELFDLLLFRGVDVNARNDEDLTALDIACIEGKDNHDYQQIIRKLKLVGRKNTRRMPNKIPDDIVNAHMVVASLIAAVTFAAIFQIPGGIEDDKNSIHYGGAKMAFSKVFRLFVFSDTAAFITSLSVVIIWLIKRQWQEISLATLLPLELSDISELNLLISIFWTLVAFLVATIIVVVPRDYDKLESKDKGAFKKYQSFLRFEILLAVFVPYLVLGLIFAANTVEWLRRIAKLYSGPEDARPMTIRGYFEWLRSTARLNMKHDILRLLVAQFLMTAVFILYASFV